MKLLWIIVVIAVLAVIVSDPWFVHTVLPVIGWGMLWASWSVLCWALGCHHGHNVGRSKGYSTGYSAGKRERFVQLRGFNEIP